MIFPKIKPFFLFITLMLLNYSAYTQNEFITKWDLSKFTSSYNEIVFGINVSAPTNYTWLGLPSGTVGSGVISGNTFSISSPVVSAFTDHLIENTFGRQQIFMK